MTKNPHSMASAFAGPPPPPSPSSKRTRRGSLSDMASSGLDILVQSRRPWTGVDHGEMGLIGADYTGSVVDYSSDAGGAASYVTVLSASTLFPIELFLPA